MEALESDNGCKDMDDERGACVYTTFLCVFVHYVDRIAFELYGDTPERKKFMDCLLAKVLELSLPNKDKNMTTEEFRDNMKTICNNKQKEYGSYALESEKGQSLKGTLAWEFGKNISNVIKGSEDDLNIAMSASTLFTMGIVKINAKGLLN